MVMGGNKSSLVELAKRGDTSAMIREYRVRSLIWPYYFQKVVLGFQDMTDSLHGKELERFLTNIQDGKRYQWIEWPRGHYKTTCFTIGMGMWFALPWDENDKDYAWDKLRVRDDTLLSRFELHSQNYCQLLAFENATNSVRKITEMKNIFEGRHLFRVCFPEIAYDGTEQPWSTEALRIRRKQGPGFSAGEASFQSIGVGGALQSQHYDILWIDDIVGEDALKSSLVMESTIGWFGRLCGIRNGPVRKMKTIFTGVSNRWSYNDVNSHVRHSDRRFVFHTRVLTEVNPETKQEEPIFPEVFTPEEVASLRETTPKGDFAAFYYNAPVPPGENEIQTENVHRYRREPDGKIVCNCGAAFYPSMLNRYGHYDPYNAKGVRSTSAPALAVVGLSTDKHVFLLDYYLLKEDYAKIFERMIQMNDNWWPLAWTYEDVGNQNMAEFYLKQTQASADFAAANHRRFRRIIPAPTKGKNNETRVRDYLLPVLQGDRGSKFAARDEHMMFWQMLETFPFEVPGHDYDLLVALAQGPPNTWKFPVAEDVEAQLKAAEQAALEELGRPYSYAVQ